MQLCGEGHVLLGVAVRQPFTLAQVTTMFEPALEQTVPVWPRQMAGAAGQTQAALGSVPWQV